MRLPSGFGGSFSSAEIFETDPKKMILKGFKRDNLGIKLICEWEGGGGSAHIRSDDKNLLNELEIMLPFWIGKPLDEIYGERF